MTSEIQPGDEVNVPKDVSKWGIKEQTLSGDESEPAVVEEVLKGLGGADAEGDLAQISHPEWSTSYFVPKDELDKPSENP